MKEDNWAGLTEAYEVEIKAVSPLSYHGLWEIAGKQNGWTNSAYQESEGILGLYYDVLYRHMSAEGHTWTRCLRQGLSGCLGRQGLL